MYRDTPKYLSDLYNDLGVLHLYTGNTGQAKKDFAKALALIENKVPDNDPRLAVTLNNLSNLYFIDRRWSLAESVMKRSLHILEQSRGSEHPEVCVLLVNLGVLYYGQGKLDSAETVQRRALSIRRRSYIVVFYRCFPKFWAHFGPIGWSTEMVSSHRSFADF